MNRMFLSFAMLLLSFACNRVESLGVADDFDPQSPMEISILMTSYTKGALVLEPKDMGSIGLYCASMGEDDWSSSTEFSKFENQRFNITEDGDCVIDGGETVSWGSESVSDKYTVFAYSPHNRDIEDVILPEIEDGELVINYSVPTSSIDQPDLMFAVPQKNIYPQISGRVSLYFYHALACVSFGVETDVDVQITAISVKDVVSSGSLRWDYLDNYDFDLDPDSDPDSNSEIYSKNGVPQWSLGETSNESFSVDIAQYTLDDDNSAQVTSEEGYLMMIPQTLPNGAEVTLTLKYSDSDDYVTKTLMIPPGSEWEAGSKYHYIIKIEEDEEEDIECGFIFNSSQISNCYIINPTPNEETIIQIPIQTRINDFWLNYSGKNTTKITSATDIETLKVVTVWEDFEEAFDYKCSLLYDDNGDMAVQFTILSEYQEGNFVFAVQEFRNDLYYTLWSWHLWFTDYNPDAIAAGNVNKIRYVKDGIYELDGYSGAVHRYKDSDDGKSTAVWSGIYAGKFIMDRNIGERNCYADDYGAGAVYYQFGRKDPFPGSCATFANGDSEPYKRNFSGFGFYESVIYSNDFFVSESSSYNWCDETAARRYSCIWFDVDIPLDGYLGEKSIFDPSPLGWMIPLNDTWNGFNVEELNCDDEEDDFAKYNYNYYGYRDALNKGALAQEGALGYVWSANPLDAQNAYSFHYSATQRSSQTDSYMTYGFPIRAIQE
ncbi:MAG: fimbrillin family protein [Rikenellaceae bacterium]